MTDDATQTKKPSMKENAGKRPERDRSHRPGSRPSGARVVLRAGPPARPPEASSSAARAADSPAESKQVPPEGKSESKSMAARQSAQDVSASILEADTVDPDGEEELFIEMEGDDEQDLEFEDDERLVFTTDAAKTGKTSRQFMKAMKRQQKLRRDQSLKEAQEMQNRAKRLLGEAKNEAKFHAQLQSHELWVARMASDLGYDPERPITEIPLLADHEQQVAFRTIVEGRAYIRTVYDTTSGTHVYELIEPKLTKNEMEITDFLRDTLIRTLDGRNRSASPDEWEDLLTRAIQQAILDHSILLDEVATQRIQYHLIRDFVGYGPIDLLMRDPGLEDISCDGPGIPIYVFHREYDSIRSNVVFESAEQLDSFVTRLAQRSGKHISIAEPLLDATLQDGSRLQCTLGKEVTSRGSSFTIRKFRNEPLTPPDLIMLGTMNSRMAAFMWLLIEAGSSMIVAGGTASGKTTTLNAVCQYIPPQKKIVSIEDTREINLNHENWIAGLTRSGFGGAGPSGRPAGAVDMYRLLEAALRQRPEYLLVGEVRGAEALTLFQAMATGHTVYSTMHADSVPSAVYRLENPPINVPRLMLQTLDLFLLQGPVRENGRMVRRVLDVTEMTGFDPDTGEILTNNVFHWDPSKGEYVYTGRSALLDGLVVSRNITAADMEQEWENRIAVLDWLASNKIRDFEQVARIIRRYYERPAEVLEQIKSPPSASGLVVVPGLESQAARASEATTGVGTPVSRAPAGAAAQSAAQNGVEQEVA